MVRVVLQISKLCGLTESYVCLMGITDINDGNRLIKSACETKR